MVIGKSYSASTFENTRSHYWTRGRLRQHYLSGAVSMTREGMQRDQLQALGTCVQVPSNWDGGQRGPWGMKMRNRWEVQSWVDPRGSWATRERGKRRGKGRTLRPKAARLMRAGR